MEMGVPDRPVGCQGVVRGGVKKGQGFSLVQISSRLACLTVWVLLFTHRRPPKFNGILLIPLEMALQNHGDSSMVPPKGQGHTVHLPSGTDERPQLSCHA